MCKNAVGSTPYLTDSCPRISTLCAAALARSTKVRHAASVVLWLQKVHRAPPPPRSSSLPSASDLLAVQSMQPLHARTHIIYPHSTRDAWVCFCRAGLWHGTVVALKTLVLSGGLTQVRMQLSPCGGRLSSAACVCVYMCAVAPFLCVYMCAVTPFVCARVRSNACACACACVSDKTRAAQGRCK